MRKKTSDFFFRSIADSRHPRSLATWFRLRRMRLFLDLIASRQRPLRVLDVGGTTLFWERMGLAGSSEIDVTLLNLHPSQVDTYSNIHASVGDARQMPQFRANEFDVVFSNSTIEHAGTLEDQVKMANEIRRVGKAIFIQTPNRYFILEPHFLVPFFQFLPLSWKVFLIRHFNLGWHKRTPDKAEAQKLAMSVRLISERELRQMFPYATLYKERFLGFTKSFIVYAGF